MLGHQNVATTQKYFGVKYASVREALEEMALDTDLRFNRLLGSSLKKETGETLFLELTRRDADKATAEIVKIGIYA